MRRIAWIAALACAFAPAVAHAGAWYDSVKLKGDVRFRNELIRQTDRGDNFRWRIRARLAVEAAVNESWSATIGLSSGSDDPVSTNQTLTGGFSRKPIELDLASVDFHPKGVPGFNAGAGKMRLPFQTADRTQLVWDNDLSPEGIALAYTRALGKKAGLFASAAGFSITDNDPDHEQWMLGGQGGLNAKPSGGIALMAGVGYYSFQRTKGMPGFYKGTVFFGNSTETVGSGTGYLRDFRELEVLGTLDARVSEKSSFRLTGDYVNNMGADSLNTAYLFGGSYTYGKDRGAVKLFANYRRLEADALIGAFTYSDFIGGGTNGKGWELGLSVGLDTNASFDVTWLPNRKGIGSGETETDYRRLMVDIATRF